MATFLTGPNDDVQMQFVKDAALKHRIIVKREVEGLPTVTDKFRIRGSMVHQFDSLGKPIRWTITSQSRQDHRDWESNRERIKQNGPSIYIFCYDDEGYSGSDGDFNDVVVTVLVGNVKDVDQK